MCIKSGIFSMLFVPKFYLFSERSEWYSSWNIVFLIHLVDWGIKCFILPWSKNGRWKWFNFWGLVFYWGYNGTATFSFLLIYILFERMHFFWGGGGCVNRVLIWDTQEDICFFYEFTFQEDKKYFWDARMYFSTSK